MGRRKPRWAELEDDLCLVDSDGMILARVKKQWKDATYRYNDREFIDAHSAKKFVEKEKFTEVN